MYLFLGELCRNYIDRCDYENFIVFYFLYVLRFLIFSNFIRMYFIYEGSLFLERVSSLERLYS